MEVCICLNRSLISLIVFTSTLIFSASSILAVTFASRLPNLLILLSKASQFSSIRVILKCREVSRQLIFLISLLLLLAAKLDLPYSYIPDQRLSSVRMDPLLILLLFRFMEDFIWPRSTFCAESNLLNCKSCWVERMDSLSLGIFWAVGTLLLQSVIPETLLYRFSSFFWMVCSSFSLLSLVFLIYFPYFGSLGSFSSEQDYLIWSNDFWKAVLSIVLRALMRDFLMICGGGSLYFYLSRQFYLSSIIYSFVVDYTFLISFSLLPKELMVSWKVYNFSYPFSSSSLMDWNFQWIYPNFCLSTLISPMSSDFESKRVLLTASSSFFSFIISLLLRQETVFSSSFSFSFKLSNQARIFFSKFLKEYYILLMSLLQTQIFSQNLYIICVLCYLTKPFTQFFTSSKMLLMDIEF